MTAVEFVGIDLDLTTSIVPTLALPDPWDEADELQLSVQRVLDITHDVKSFVFAAPSGTAFAFEPGQFLTFRLDVGGQEYQRCYTVSSPPTRPYLVSITVKRVPGGPVSTWLHENVRAGDTLTVRAPLGAFTLDGPPAPKYLFLSAGSGATPLMSMTRTLSDLGSDADVLYLHSARTPVDILFRSELDAMAAVQPNLRVFSVCEDDHPTQRWSGLRGRLSAPMLQALVPDLAERQVYTCGPAPYMAAVRQLLGELGHDPRQYHEESFSFEDLAPITRPPAEVEVLPAACFQVEFVRSGRTVRCEPGQSVLAAATMAGVRIPSSCTQGMCGTCKTSKLSGEVTMQHNGGIRPKEIAQGKVLLCCSTPLTDLRLDA